MPKKNYKEFILNKTIKGKLHISGIFNAFYTVGDGFQETNDQFPQLVSFKGLFL